MKGVVWCARDNEQVQGERSFVFVSESFVVCTPHSDFSSLCSPPPPKQQTIKTNGRGCGETHTYVMSSILQQSDKKPCMILHSFISIVI